MTVPNYRTTPARAEALAELYVAIGRADDKGEVVPCVASSSGWWLSDDAEEQEAAAWRCMQCPVITSCAGYIEHHGELAGVWAGITQGDRTKRTRKTGEPS